MDYIDYKTITNPNDWYFWIVDRKKYDECCDDEPRIFSISTNEDYWEDDLSSEDIPDNIKEILNPFIDMSSRIMESLWEVTSDLPEEELIKRIEELGFIYVKNQK